MDSQSIIIIILIILCIIGVVVNYKKTLENFVQSTCSFKKDSTKDTSDYVCVARCISEMDVNKCDATKCLEACGRTESACEVKDSQGTTLYTTCQINAQTDIGSASGSAGNTIKQCVANCSDATCDGCTNFVIRDPQTGRRVKGTYTNNLNDFLTKCDSQIINHKYCSPCVEACYHCSDPIKCQWIDNTGDVDRKQIFKDTAFSIGVIPDDKKAIIVWNEGLPFDLIRNYEIFIYRKAEVNSDSQSGKQKTPLVVRRETMRPADSTNQTFEVTGLSNGETYSINVNKVFNSSSSPEIKASNTVDVVPSKVNLVNFSQINRETTSKQQKYLSNGILNDLTGKSFDITL